MFKSVDAAKKAANIMKSSLETSGVNVSHSQALECVAHMSGARDWNTMSAALSGAKEAPQQMVPNGVAQSADETDALLKRLCPSFFHDSNGNSVFRSNAAALLEVIRRVMADRVFLLPRPLDVDDFRRQVKELLNPQALINLAEDSDEKLSWNTRESAILFLRSMGYGHSSGDWPRQFSFATMYLVEDLQSVAAVSDNP